MNLRYFHLAVFLFALVFQSPAQLRQQGLSSGESNHVREVRLEGLQFVDPELVLQQISVLSATSYHPSLLRSKVKKSVTSLWESGLFEDIQVNIDYTGKGDEVDLVFVLVEHRALHSWKIEGNDEILTEDLEPLLSLVEGQVFGPSHVERDRQAILRHYREEGFLLAEVGIETTMDSETGKTDLVFLIREGRKVMVESIEFKGNKSLEPDNILSHMTSEVDHWWSSGEFKQEVFDEDVDSVLHTFKSSGFLDAAVLNHKVDYIPDPLFHLYLGRVVREGVELQVLLDLVNRDLKKEGHPLAVATGKVHLAQDHYYRRYRSGFGKQGQALPVKVLETEEDLVNMVNNLMDQEEESSAFVAHYIDSLSKTSPLADSLAKLEELSNEDRRSLTRLALEFLYPIRRYAETNSSAKVRLTVELEEGRRYYAGNFTFLGNEVLPDRALNSQVFLDSGKVFDYGRFEATRMGVTNLYREDGYLFVQLTDKRSYRDSIVDVAFEVVEGKPASVHKVVIKGNSKTKDKVVRREIKLFPGDVYRQSLMERSFRDIMQLNYFDNVMPDIKVRGEQEVDLLFRVMEREAGTGTFSAGMAYNGTNGMVGTLALSIPNCCMGDGQKADINLEYGAQRRNVSFGFSEPWFLDTPTRVGGSVNWSWYWRVNEAPITRYGFTSFLGRRLTWPDDYFYVQSNYSLQRNEQGSNITRTLGDGSIQNSALLYSGFESALGFSIIRDDKNLPIFPTEGSRYSISTQYAGLGGDFQYIKNDATIKWWFPFFSGLALSLESQVGVIEGEALQNRTLYRMGGILGYQGKLRGYSTGSIGSYRLGRSYLNFTAEFTYPVAENRFYLLAFADAGNVYGDRYQSFVDPNQLSNPWREIDPGNLKRDFGMGFRVIVPMLGIIGFDFAWPLDPAENPSTGGDLGDEPGGMEFNFVIGQGF